jgi:Mg-chelatase subunit ChlD
MKRSILVLVSLCIVIVLQGLTLGQAQESGPVVDILGRPDSSSDPPNIQAYISVVDPNTGRTVDGLENANFSVQVSEEDIQATATSETTGIAVVIVIDRGGIAKPYDPRIGQAVDLADSLLDLLNVDGSPSADMVALIGIRGRENGGLIPLVPFTDYDPNAVQNEFNVLRTEPVNEVTPLYDGIDQAIEWITNNPDTDIQVKLAHRRPMIVVFSDGIDKNYSDEARRIDIIDKCTQNDVLLYTVRMGRGTTDEYNVQIMAERTNGIYVSHENDSDTAANDLFQNIVTQRQTYRVTFPLYRPQGDYQVRIQVLDTAIGDGSDMETVSSRLQVPQIALTSPADNADYTVAYSQTIEGFESLSIPLSVEITPADGISRDPTEVSYFANGVFIGTSTAPPGFDFSWDVSTVVTATDETQVHKYTLTAEGDDTYLDEQMESDPVTVEVTWEGKAYTFLDRLIMWLSTNWWLLLILMVLAVGLLVLLFLLLRMRGEMARKVVARTTGVLKGVTRRLGAGPRRAPGKLVVLQGANMGRELRLAAQVVKVGRDPQFCDFALYDEYASNPHFSIQLDQTQFFITDEGSTNGTRLNGTLIPPHQRMLLQPNAIIEVGQTRLQFMRVGGTTRQLGGQSGAPPAAGSSPTMPTPPPGQAPPPHPPTQPAAPPSAPDQRGGPTRKV